LKFLYLTSKEVDMANIVTFHFDTPGGGPIPADGTSFFTIGPADAFATGAITVTAIPTQFAPGGKPMFIEVVQMATRKEGVFGGGANFFLDIVVRNNSHVGAPEESTIEKYDVFVSVVQP
jgi:hypothetical protein